MQDAEQRVSVHMTLWLSEAILDTNLGKEPQSRAPGKDQGSHKAVFTVIRVGQQLLGMKARKLDIHTSDLDSHESKRQIELEVGHRFPSC
jgi:hypothetical protein